MVEESRNRSGQRSRVTRMAQASEIASGRALHGLGIIVGSPAAARCFARLPESGAPLLVTSHGDPGRARAGARQLAAKGARAIVSFGPAVGLAPLLRPGDLVVAECVVLPSGKTVATDRTWRAQLARSLSALNPNLKVARLAGRDRLAVSADEKRAVFQATFAAALDSESHAVAEVAEAEGLPFVAIRAVADPAEESRPPAAYRASRRDAYAASMLACLGRPWELPAVWRFARNRRAALATLRQVAALGPGPLAFGG
jgi:adenosylhomocysteine nucleosidase